MIGVFVVTLVAGAAGRFCFDFSVRNGSVEIERAFIEGMREPVRNLPGWIGSVRERIEDVINV